MAKETTIIFVYDTELLKKEEDDPNSAILYFYPTWVSDQQKTALCGQLMGTVMCLKSILAMPKKVSLQTGKFFLIENGRYILVVGTDRNIPDWVLEHRATLIYSLVNFFHKDFTNLGQLYKNETLNVKLYHIFDTYLKLLFLGGCIFSHMPLLDLSKTDNSILTNAQVFLDSCKTISNILGGLLLYHNRVIHTQLSVQTTKKIVFSDPFRIKNPAELSDLNFEVPVGVKLLQVYIASDEYQDLYRGSTWEAHSSESKALDNTDTDSGQIIRKNVEESATPSTSSVKNETPLLFTSVPEESTFSPRKEAAKTSLEKRKTKKSRPNSLNLKSCSLDSTGDGYLGKRKTPITPYWNQTSAVCTPMTETKSFVDQSDARTNKDDAWKLSLEFYKMCISQNSSTFKYPNLNGDPDKDDSGEASQYYQQTVGFSCPLEVYTRRLEKAARLATFVQNTLKKSSVYRTSSLGNLPRKNSILFNQYSNFRNKISFRSKDSISLRRRKSIHDPLFPWFKQDKVAASQYYVEEVLDEDFFIGKNEREEYTFRELITERKRSLTLPIKPHNASEAQKTDMRSPGGYRTPLMNKLSMPNPVDRGHSSKEIPVAPLVSQDANKKTEASCELQKCVLFMYGERDLVAAMLLTEECLKNKKTIEKLHQLCAEQLPSLEELTKSSIGPPKSSMSSETSPYSILTLDSEWDTLKRCGPWDGVDLNDLTRLHGDFLEHKDIDEISIRRPDSVLFGHRDGPTEVFYHETTTSASGLLSPNDALGSVHQIAKKKLEKYHDVFIK